MTTLITIFILSLFFSMVLTPNVGNLAIRYGWVDIPNDRKVHKEAIPRVGGIAIFIAFFLPFAVKYVYPTFVFDQLIWNRQMVCFIAGASLVFVIGIIDDISSLNPWVKLAGQIIAAGIACYGGIIIQANILPWGFGLHYGILAVPVTIFWFLIVMNAINLIDGLDGLAAGIVFFASCVLLVFAISYGQLAIAMGFAALGGSALGFLRYNFNPATIFMGDGGSYFLGYMMASLSIMSSFKTHAAAAMLIPVIALGVPLFDTILSPIRRFVRGRGIFSPDKSHLHHRLLRLGLTHRNAVLVLYGCTVFMGIMALLVINARDERGALVLVVLGLAMILGVRKLGYFEYLAADKVLGWLKDLTDESGISRERRSFLSVQIDIGRARDVNDLWEKVGLALERLQFDMAELNLHRNGWAKERLPVWKRNGFDECNDVCKECLLKMELPLVSDQTNGYGTLWLIKDLKANPISHYTLRRVEHLRRTVMGTLARLEKEGKH